MVNALDSYEYPICRELEGLSRKCFRVPYSLIVNKDMDNKRVLTFSFLNIRKGLDDKVELSLNNLVRYNGLIPNNRAGKTNDAMLSLLNQFRDMGYINYEVEPTLKEEGLVVVNTEMLNSEFRQNRFSVLYIDEVLKILNYDYNGTDKCITAPKVLLVFAFLRCMIYKRRNKLLPEEINKDNKNSYDYDIKCRRYLNPEAYNASYNDIADMLGLSRPTVTKSINILKELDLIAVLVCTNIEDSNGEYRNVGSIYANTYKREGTSELANGYDYYHRELLNKMDRVHKYFKNKK